MHDSKFLTPSQCNLPRNHESYVTCSKVYSASSLVNETPPKTKNLKLSHLTHFLQQQQKLTYSQTSNLNIGNKSSQNTTNNIHNLKVKGKHKHIKPLQGFPATELIEEKQHLFRNYFPTFKTTKHSLSNTRFLNFANFASRSNLNTKLVSSNNICSHSNRISSCGEKQILNMKNEIDVEKIDDEHFMREKKKMPFERHVKNSKSSHGKLAIPEINRQTGNGNYKGGKKDNLSLRGSNTKLSKWGSIVGLRDSIRNLTSCVSLKSSNIQSNSHKPIDRKMRDWSQDSLDGRATLEQKKLIEEEKKLSTSGPSSKQNFSQFYKNQQSLLLLPSSLALVQPASSNSRNTPIVEPKIKIKKKSKQKLSPIKSQDQANLKESSSGSHSQPILKKKGEFKDEESNQDVLDMIEKVQSNGFDDQRYKQPCSIPTGSSATEFLSKFPTISNYTNKQLQSNYSNSQISPFSSPLVHTKQALKEPEILEITNDKPLTPTQSMSQKKQQLIESSKNLTTEERLFQLLTTKADSQHMPMVSLPDNDNYWSEGWKSAEAEMNSNNLSIVSSTSSPVSSSSASPLSSASSSPSSFFQTSSSSTSSNQQTANKIQSQLAETTLELTSEYLEAFNDKQHLIFYGHDSLNSPIILSYRTEIAADSRCCENIRAILRTKEKNYCMTIPVINLSGNNSENPDNVVITPSVVCKTLCPDIKIKFFYPLTDLNGFKLVKNFDNHTLNRKLKFGVIYMKKGQTTEEELFSNQEHSESFDKFLNLLGERIKLKGHTGFRGGLDTANGQTGDYSVYSNYRNKEIMFHVSTLLPFSKTDQQQLERKRHIGNDIVAVVFQEENTPFAPDMIASNFLHTFIVVQKYNDPKTGKEKYRVSVVARKDVPNFSPPITTDSIYDCDDEFKDWLLSKLLNAEVACYKAEKFKKLNERTRCALFNALYNELHEKNMRVVQSVFYNANQEDTGNDPTMSVHNNLSSRVSEISQSSISSNLVQSATTQNGSSNNLSNHSAAFKFSLLNTVRKAFKKSESNVKQATPVSSQSSHRHASHSQSLPMNPSAPVLNSPTKSVASITDQQSVNEGGNSNNNNAVPIGRYRSSTFDAGSFKSSLLTKNQLEPQQAKEMFSTKKNIKTDRLSKQMDYHLYGKLGVGSIDSLNNIENYSHGYKMNPNMNPATSPSNILPNHSVSGSKQVPTKPKSLNLNNMSLSDLTNGVRYKNNAGYFNYDNRSGSSSPEGNSSNNASNMRADSKRQGFSKLAKNSLMKSASSIRHDDSDTGMGSLTPNSSGLSSTSTTDFYSTIIPHANNLTNQSQHSMIIK